jgi:hypothetical protein
MKKQFIILRVMFAISFFLFIIMILLTPVGEMTEAYILSVLVFAAGTVVLIWCPPQFQAPRSIISFLLSALLLLQLSVSQVFQNFQEVTVSRRFGICVYKFLFLCMLSLSAWIALDRFLLFLLNRSFSEERGLKQIPFFRLNVLTVPVALMTIFLVAASYPHYNYSDMNNVWNLVVSGTWDEWHTVGYELFVKIFSFNGTNWFSISIFQGFLWILTVNYAINVIYQVTHSHTACVIYSVISTIVITPSVYCGMLVKDSIYCICITAFCVSVMDVLYSDRISYLTGIALAFSGIGTSIFRHAGWVSIICTLTGLCLYLWRKDRRVLKPIIAVALGIVCCTVFVNQIFSHEIVNAKRNPDYIKYSVPLYNVGSVLNSGVEPEKADMDFLTSIMPIETWKNAVSSIPYWADNVSREYGMVGNNILKLNDRKTGIALIKLNLKWLIRYPRAYLSAEFDISSILWEIGTPANGYEWAPVRGDAMDWKDGNSTLVRTPIRNAAEMLEEFTAHTSFFRELTWRGGIWLFLLVFSITVTTLKGNMKNLIAYLPPSITTLLLFLSIPAQDPRYILYLLEIVGFLLPLSLFSNSNKDTLLHDCGF